MAQRLIGIQVDVNRSLYNSGLISCLILIGACSAQLGGKERKEAPPSESPEGTPSPWTPGGEAGDPHATTGLRLRLITSAQYDATLDLLVREHYGIALSDIDLSGTLQGEFIDDSGFTAVGEVTEVSVLRYLDAAHLVVGALGHDGVDVLAGCDVDSQQDSSGCIATMVQTFGRLLYRRPLTEEEVSNHKAFWDQEREELGSSAREATEQLLRSMLTSPNFLYRWEALSEPPVVENGVIRLSSYQTASRLAFFLWGSGPSAELIDLAESGGLDTDEEVLAQAIQMLQSPRAENSLLSFHRGWLHLDKLDGLFKDPARFPQWGPSLRQAMQDEIELFVKHVILDDDARLSTLLTASYSFLNEELADVYGVEGVFGTELRRVELPPGERSGLLTMPGLLAAASEPSVENPFRRGKLLLEQVMCHKLEPPPNLPAIPPPDENNPEPVRVTLEEMTAVSSCSGCHQHINPFGFAFGNYNAIGGYQTEDELGFPIDASGQLTSGESFADASSLVSALAEHPDVRGCVTKQWFRFALGRAEVEADDYSLSTAYQSFESSDFDIRELLAALVTSRSFLYRSPDPGEVTQ